MSVELDIEVRRGVAKGDVDVSRDPVAVLAALTHRPRLSPRLRPEQAELDPLAGEDEPWADEDLLRSPDAEDYVRFLRTLWIAILVCAVFWVALAVGGLKLVGILG